MKRFEEWLRLSQLELLKKKNVVAVGIGTKKVKGKDTGERAIVCSVTRKVPLSALGLEDWIPVDVKGVQTDVIETGEIKALLSRTDRWRPAPGGVSIGHEWITAGTLGCLVRKKGEHYPMILSNNHVLADSNNAPLDSPILQPGKHDGGTLIDRIATLEEFVGINWLGGNGGCKIGSAVAAVANFISRILGRTTRLKAYVDQQLTNLVDAAIASPLEPAMDFVQDLILEIGVIAGVNYAPDIGLEVQKSGRTTGVTKGAIAQLQVMTQVQYGEGKLALFEDQILIEQKGFSAGGDSGTAILDMDRKLVGLLFAGSDTTTVFNPIKHVFSLLDLELFSGLEKECK
jgi:hypothetical protein